MIPRSPAIRHDMKKSQDAKNIPPIGPNIMTNIGGSLYIFLFALMDTR